MLDITHRSGKISHPPRGISRDAIRALRRKVPRSEVAPATDSGVAYQITPLHFPILNGVREDEIYFPNAQTIHPKFAKKQYLYFPYDNTEKVYYIIHGNIEIGYLDESGRELSIDILGSGEIFGSLLGRNFSGGFARSIGKSMLAVLNRDDFENFLERSSRCSFRILKMMNHRISFLETKLQNLVFSDVKTRICKLLFSLYEKSGDKQSGHIRIPLTHQDIANLVASSRETASLHLSDLKKSGTIAYERKRIQILSLSALQQHI